MRPRTGTDAVIGNPTTGTDVDALSTAGRAADAAGVEVRALHDIADLDAVNELVNRIWRPGTGGSLVSVELLRALSHAGNYVAGAFDGLALVGACVGFLADPPGDALHSHIAGVAADAQGRNIGYALKLHQRAWAIERGLSKVTWTADPLVRRNAYFNIVKLGARPVDYVIDFYGHIGDAINAGQGTDRLLFGWDLSSSSLGRDGHGQPSDAVILLSASATGRPLAAPSSALDAPGTGLVYVPADVEALRRKDPLLGLEWRHALRDVLGELIADGARVNAFTRSGCYVVERGTQ